MQKFKQYERKSIAEMRDIDSLETKQMLLEMNVSISAADMELSKDEFAKGMIGRSFKNHQDMWYISKSSMEGMEITPVTERKLMNVMCEFKPNDKQYAFFTYHDIKPGQQVVVDLGTRSKIVTATTPSTSNIDPNATSWIVTPIDMNAHNEIINNIMEDKQ